MATLKFYKGETINVLFTARDDSNNPINLSGYDKDIRVFTAFTTPIDSTVIPIDSSSFKITITPEQSDSLSPGTLYIVVVLSNSSGVQIGRSTFPVLLLDPESPNSEDRESQEGTDLEMKISLGEKVANVKMYIPSMNFPPFSGIYQGSDFENMAIPMWHRLLNSWVFVPASSLSIQKSYFILGSATSGILGQNILK